MKKEIGSITAAILIYSLLMLCMMGVVAFHILQHRGEPTAEIPEATAPQTQYIYVYAEPSESETSSPDEQTCWIVREHERRIGIFSSDGVLLQLLEIYTNTLPQADQRLLREGITVETRSDLYALIEDYSE